MRSGAPWQPRGDSSPLDPFLTPSQGTPRLSATPQWIHSINLPTSLATPMPTRVLNMFPAGLTRANEKRKVVPLMYFKPPGRLNPVALLEPLEKQENISNFRKSRYHARIPSRAIDISSDSDTEPRANDSQPAPFPSLISDGDESVYQSADEENDQVCSLNSFPPRISNSILDW